MDLSQIPTEDLLKAAQGPDLSSMSNEDLMKAAGVKQGSGIAANYAGGANSRIADLLGFPAKVANAVLTAPAHYAARAVAENVIDPVFGIKRTEGDWAKAYENSRLGGESQDIKDLMGKAGFDPRNVTAVTPGEKFAKGAGGGTVDALSMLMPATAVANTAKAGSLTSEVAKTLAAQPVTQVVSNAVGQGTGDATDSPTLGMIAGVGTAGAMGLGKAAIDNALAKRSLINSAPTTDALRSQAKSAYDAADQAGLVVSDKSFGNAVKDITDTAVNAGIDKDIHPKASAVLRRLAEEADTPKTLQDLDILRRVAKSAASSIEPDERRIGSLMVDKLDDYVTNLKPIDVVSGDAKAANDALTSARQSWQQRRKSEMIDGLIEKAQSQASGVENGLRIQFRQLLRNPKALRGFTPDEVNAIRDVAEGNFTRNTLRRLGKVSFGSGVQSNVLGGLGGATAAHMLAGGAAGPAAFAVPLAGYGAQRGAQALTQNAANYARALAASGGTAPSMAPTSLGQMLMGNQTKGLNASLLAKVLMEQSRLPALSPVERQ